jgi:hypothetical protein
MQHKNNKCAPGPVALRGLLCSANETNVTLWLRYVAYASLTLIRVYHVISAWIWSALYLPHDLINDWPQAIIIN